MAEEFNLQRFVDAQAGSYQTALGEIHAGAKRSHWMWFIFPQFAGLGESSMAKFYAIGSIEEARAYLHHPLLGSRLRECVAALKALPATKAEAVFGPIDAVKLRSSLTLFSAASDDPLFAAALDCCFGSPDPKTLKLLQNQT